MDAPQKPLPPHIQAFADQLGTFKASLKARGLNGQQVGDQPDVKRMTDQLNQMKVQAGLKETSKETVKTGSQLPPQVQAYSDQLNALKDQLRARGLAGAQVKNHPQVAEMQGQLNNLKKLYQGGMYVAQSPGVAPGQGVSFASAGRPAMSCSTYAAAPAPMPVMRPAAQMISRPAFAQFPAGAVGAPRPLTATSYTSVPGTAPMPVAGYPGGARPCMQPLAYSSVGRPSW